MFFTGSPGAEAFIYTYIKNKWFFSPGVFPRCCYVKSVTLNFNLSHVMLPICPNLSLVKLVPSTCGLSVVLINGYHTYSVCLRAGKWLMKCWKRRDGSSAGISVWCQRPSRVPFSSKVSESPESTVGERGQMHALKSRSTKTCALMRSLPALRDELFCMCGLFFKHTSVFTFSASFSSSSSFSCLNKASFRMMYNLM